MNSDVAHFTTHQSTCLVTNQVAAGCEKLLQTVEIRSTFVIKSVHDVHFTDPRQSCFAINDGISNEVQKNINKPTSCRFDVYRGRGVSRIIYRFSQGQKRSSRQYLQFVKKKKTVKIHVILSGEGNAGEP